MREEWKYEMARWDRYRSLKRVAWITGLILLGVAVGCVYA